MEASNGVMARLIRAERDIERLVDKKADYDDVLSLRAEISEVKRILMWFMGIASVSLVSGFGIVIGILIK